MSFCVPTWGMSALGQRGAIQVDNNWTPLQASPTPIWTIHHHQGYRGQLIRAQYSTIPWFAPSVQCGLPSALLSTSTWHIRSGRTTHTNRVKPQLHGTSHNWSNYGHTDQENPPAKDLAISSCQSRPTPSPRTKFNRSFLISWRNSTQWRPLLHKGGGVI